MKYKKLSLFFFVDALGWQVLTRHPFFLEGIVQEKKKLETILGYSSACDPSIITGKVPSVHGLWSSYFYSPTTSPFKNVSLLAYLPPFIRDYHKVRGRLSRWIAKKKGFTGYFQLYNFPFCYLKYFDYAEKENIFTPQGIGGIPTIFTLLTKKQIPYYLNVSADSDERKIEKLRDAIKQGEIQFAYTLLGGLDSLMHRVGTRDVKVSSLLEVFDGQIRSLVELGEEYYDEVTLHVFSDHGMHDVKEGFDLQAEIESLGLTFGTDYVAVYDSTMARFWYLHEQARKKIEQKLQSIAQGRILTDQELREFHVFFLDHKYGETIFLMHSSLLIVPSFMGKKKIAGMHGYDPRDAESFACLLSSQKIAENIQRIEQIYHVISSEALGTA